jgi:protein-disulfide isomerase
MRVLNSSARLKLASAIAAVVLTCVGCQRETTNEELVSRLAEPCRGQVRQTLDTERCPCGCGFSLGECQFREPRCPLRGRIVRGIVKRARESCGREPLIRSARLEGLAAVRAALKLAATPVEVSIGDSPVRGPADAALTVVAFSDFECPSCRRAEATLSEVLAGRSDIRLVFKHFPLESHVDGRRAAEAAALAARSGLFWQMHDALFDGGPLDEDSILARASRAGLGKLGPDLRSGAGAPAVAADVAAGRRLGVDATPTFFVAGHRLVGGITAGTWRLLLDAEARARSAEPEAAAQAIR